MKTCLSEGKLTKQFRNPPPLTNPHISEQFFHEPHHCPNFKISDPPSSPNFRGEEETIHGHSCYANIRISCKKSQLIKKQSNFN